LESIYKIDTGSDHVAKFHGDRPRELGDYALKKKIKKKITGKTEDLPYYRTGRSNKCCSRCEGSEDTASEISENRHF